jgi:hypothetical protein
LIKSHLSISALLPVMIKKIFSKVYVKKLFPMFSSSSFIVSVLTFMSLIHFVFVFVCGVRQVYNSILLHVDIVFPTLFTEDAMFSSLCILGILVQD